MATYHTAEAQKWTAEQQKQLQALKKRWETANASGEKTAETAASGLTAHREPSGTAAAEPADDFGREALPEWKHNHAQNVLELWKKLFDRIGSGSGSAAMYGSGGEAYLDQMYQATLDAQLESLKAAYQQNLSNLDAEAAQTEDFYREQKRQTAGEAERMAANWREVANAYGLNSGAVGQAALAMNNQRQSDLNALGMEQAAALTELQRQRTLLGQEYQSAINQALAENNYARASALYQEAVRMEELLRENGGYYTGLPLKQWWTSR